LERYISKAVREAAIERIRSISTWIEPSTPIRACRNPRDNKFLEVAVHGRADVIVTGDADLLALDPFRGIAILTPAGYLERK
jgi:putative PIN family toxin of toxin-antitoxin system